jgi:hypothetical protein
MQLKIERLSTAFPQGSGFPQNPAGFAMSDKLYYVNLTLNTGKSTHGVDGSCPLDVLTILAVWIL